MGSLVLGIVFAFFHIELWFIIPVSALYGFVFYDFFSRRTFWIILIILDVLYSAYVFQSFSIWPYSFNLIFVSASIFTFITLIIMAQIGAFFSKTIRGSKRKNV